MKTENKQIKASSWILGILFVISAAVLVMFFGVGYNETYYSGGKNLTAPTYTGLLLIWLYALVGICILSVFGFGIVSAIRNIGAKSSGGRKGFAGWVFLFTFAAIAVSYFLADTSSVLLGDGKTLKTAENALTELILSDVCLYSIYALVIVAILSALLSMIGVFKARK